MTAIKPKILIVDDEPNNHRVYERTLSPLNLSFVKAMSGQQALAVAHRHDFFLILMDVQMPGMDGFETASLILQHPKTRHIPVIFITAFALDEHFEFKGYDSGAVDYLIKPINDDIVRSKVRVFLALYLEKLSLDNANHIRQKAEEKLRAHKAQLEDLVKARTLELQQSLDDLMKTKNQLVESEKMAALGRLVAGIAHELNTPIGICITAMSYLQDKTIGISETFANAKLKKSDFNEFISASKQSSEIITTNLNRASDLISNFKLVAVDVSNEMVRSFQLLEYLHKVIKSLSPEIKRAKHQIEISGDSTLIVRSCPGSFSQIITNLVMNSLIHGYDPGNQGHITINIDTEGEQVRLVYSDDGKGMNEDIVTMIFEPFFTTRRGMGGSGLGMHIVYNLVTQTLGGEVVCSSTPGKGSCFVITFPKLQAQGPAALLKPEEPQIAN